VVTGSGIGLILKGMQQEDFLILPPHRRAYGVQVIAVFFESR
jgi:hypothetical protein